MATAVLTITETARIGKALAALVSAGIGCAALGLFVVLAEVSTGLRSLLNFHNPVGPLSGKTTLAVVVWLAAWALLSRRFQATPPAWRTALLLTWVLIGLGFVGTFPPFFALFTPHP
jgi:hypothetical protein